MKIFISFLRENSTVIVLIVLGILIGYFYWYNWGIYYGTLPLSSECWVNCTYGELFGGLVGSFVTQSETQ